MNSGLLAEAVDRVDAQINETIKNDVNAYSSSEKYEEAARLQGIGFPSSRECGGPTGGRCPLHYARAGRKIRPAGGCLRREPSGPWPHGRRDAAGRANDSEGAANMDGATGQTRQMGGMGSFSGTGGLDTQSTALTTDDWIGYGIMGALLVAAILVVALWPRRKWKKGARSG